MNKKKIGILVIAVVVIAALLFGLGNNEKTSKDKKSEKKEELITESKLVSDSEFSQSESESGSSQSDGSQQQYASFPFSVNGTALIVDGVRGYDGIFLENGEDSKISNVSAMIVRNNGSSCIEYAKIICQNQSGNQVFEVTGLEAGATAVVMESQKCSFSGAGFENIYAESVAELESFDMLSDTLKVEETKEGKLKVKNISSKTIPSARIFYKFYDKESDVYVGGITYTAKVENLKAGKTAEIQPSHYSAGNSKIIMIRTYDSK